MDELTEQILDLMDHPDVTAKRMFGGVGFFREGLMFALIAYEELYLKVDADNEAEFEALGLGLFEYEFKDGRRSTMSYRKAPPEALESPSEMRTWAEKGFAAACRADAAKPKSKRKRSL